MAKYNVKKVNDWDITRLNAVGIIVDNPNTLAFYQKGKDYKKNPADIFQIGHAAWSSVLDQSETDINDIRQCLIDSELPNPFHNIGVFDSLQVREGYFGKGYEAKLVQQTMVDMRNNGNSLSVVLLKRGDKLAKHFEDLGFSPTYIGDQVCYVQKLK